MIDIAHWLASFVILSVALARLEAITVTATGARQWFGRAAGWCFIGLSSFDGIIAPFFGYACIGNKLGMIGFAVLAITYKWEGAAPQSPHQRRASDKRMGGHRVGDH